MANTILTPLMITRAAVTLFVNTNEFIKNIDRQYDPQFAQTGAKIGSTLNIRLPPSYVVTRGPGASVQDIRETQIPLTIAFQDHIDIAFTTFDLTLSVQDFSKRFLANMINTLAGSVAATIMASSEGNISNLVWNNSSGLVSPNSGTVLSAEAMLDDNSAPDIRRFIVTDPWTNARVTDTLKGLFNPSPTIGEQFRSGRVKSALSFDWFKDQTVIKHTTGTFSAGGTVNGAGQSGNSILVNAITGTLKKGDVITFAGVNAVNKITFQDTGMLKQFVVTADVPTGSVTIPIAPALIPSNAGASVQYQTVMTGPANGAAMALVIPAGTIYRKNFAFVKETATMATADMELPPNTETARQEKDGISMRYVRQYQVGSDQTVSRLDTLYGVAWPRPEWGVVVADAI